MGREWGFRRLANALDAIEATDVEIRDVRVPDDSPRGGLEADIHVRIPVEVCREETTSESLEVDGAEGPVTEDVTDGIGDDEGTDGIGEGAGSSHERQDSGTATDGMETGAETGEQHEAGTESGGSKTRQPSPEGSVTEADRTAAFETVAPESVAESDEMNPAERTDERPAERDSTRTAVEVGSEREPSSVDGDGEIACLADSCAEVFDSEHGMKIHHAKVHGLSEEADDVPAYRDPEALSEVYEEYDSFPEMTDALGVDVAPQTVRRNMIKHGIHQPTVSDDGPATEPNGTTTTDGSREYNASAKTETTVATDGDTDNPSDSGAGASAVSDLAPDLPGGVTVQDVKSAVLSAETLYEVQEVLGVDRETAKKILCTLNLLELVHGRVATKQQREKLKAQIDERIANRSAGT